MSPWIVRTLSPDYGLDCEVELVTGDGTVTGATFKVQIKATDERDIDRALRVRMPIDRVHYALDQDVPTLLARYHAPSRTFYADWFHAVAHDVSEETATVTVTLPKTSAVTSARLRQLGEHVNASRALRRASESNRVPIRLHLPSGDAFGFSKTRIQLAVRTLFDGTHSAFCVSSKDDDPIVVVKFHGDAIHGLVADELTTSLSDRRYRESELDQIAADAGIIAATAVARAGHPGLAVPLIAAAFVRSSVPDVPEALVDIANIFVLANRPYDLLAIAEESQSQLAVRGWRTVKFFVPALVNAPVRETDLGRVEQLLRRHADDAHETQGPIEEATARFNVATFLRVRRGSGDEAIRFLEEAQRLNPQHADRDYYHADLAGAYFNAGRFQESSISYARALELGVPDDDYRALLADAHLMCGKYEDALENLRRYGAVAEVMSPPHALKYAEALWLVEMLGVATQERDEVAAHRILDDDDKTECAQRMANAQRALGFDALCAKALGRWAACSSELGNLPRDFAGALLLAADVMGDEHEAWVHACLALAVSDESWDMFTTAAIEVAYERCGQQFVAALQRRADELGTPVLGARLIEVIDDLVQASDMTGRHFGLRIVNPDTNSYEVVSQ